MGLALHKPILSKVVDRAGNNDIYAACCAMNGFRSSMEDAHILIAEESEERCYFGIFDGHRNDSCSQYVAAQLPRKLKSMKDPITAEALEKACIEVDTAFLKLNNDGGSTGTFCIVHSPTRKVTTANVGDSRILICRKGEVMFSTEDHKPSNPIERERIIRCGGSISDNRVDGDLAVSRAFGDGLFKVPGSTDYKNQKVIAVPDVAEFTCEKGDVIILACDGVFEGNFSNAEVASFVAAQLEKCWGDLGVVAARVCDEAIRRGSKDNISCMLVQFEEGASKVASQGASSFVPGPPFPRNHEGCRTAYTKMAEMGHTTVSQALQTRYQLFQHYNNKTLDTQPPIMRIAFEMSDEVDLDIERTFFGKGPSPGNEKAFFDALSQGR